MELEKVREELSKAKAEVINKDMAITTLKKQLTESAAELERVMAEFEEEKENAIATLKTELKKLEDNLAEATRNETFLSEELQRFKYGVVPSEESHGEQLQLFPPEEQAAVTPEPEEPENDTTEVLQSEISLLDSVEGTVSASGLMEHIKDMKKRNRNFPDPPEKTQTFTDAATGKTKRLKELEEMYGFKLVGYVMKGSRREYRYKILDN